MGVGGILVQTDLKNHITALNFAISSYNPQLFCVLLNPFDLEL
jgi:hypothetical protein